MKKKTEKPKPKSNPILNGLVNTFFDIVKHFLKDFENIRKVKKIDKFSEEFFNLEHMLIRLEKKLDDNRHHIEDLKARLLWGNIVIIVLILINIFQLIK
ncbi:MAG: hypothetical protein SVM86_00510 [Candidatus Cloacimonadota bacterium]|nr:hypothetical protein [Candidatus Cloacimonadota bacterium]